MSEEPRLVTRSELLGRGVRPERDRTRTRVRRGIYAPAPSPRRAGPSDSAAARTEAYRMQVLAAHRTLTGDHVFSHESAAVMLGLPVLGPWPPAVHLVCERRSGGRSQLDVVRHCLGLEAVQPVVVDGVLVTSPARTVFDLALTRSFRQAIVSADAALTFPGAQGELASLVEWYGHGRGYQRLARVVAFADARSQSPGESLSRVLMDELGFERPVLQFEVVTDGRSEWADFGWLGGRILGEFDGEVKYRDDRYRLGGTVEDVVIREKNRENRMRRGTTGFARWDWRDLRANRLGRILAAAGVPRSGDVNGIDAR